MIHAIDKSPEQGTILSRKDVLSGLVLEARKQVETLERPNPKMEAWRFTSVSRLLTTDFTLEKPDSEVDGIQGILKSCRLEGCRRLVIINGRFSSKYSDIDSLPAEVEATTLKEAAEKYPELIGSRLSGIVPMTDSTFVAANTTKLDRGLFLRIPDAAKITSPLQLLYITIGDADTYSAPRALLLVGKNASVELIEQFTGIESLSYFNNSVTEISLGESSALTYYRLQDESDRADHISSLGFDQAGGSSLNAGIFDFGGRLSRNDISVHLRGEHCDTHLSGLQILTGRQHGDNHTLINHARPRCRSNELFKSVLGGKARSVFNGKIQVAEGAEETDSVLTNRNLLLSKDARVNSNPQLEIYTDNVKCSHGSATGQLNEDALFYFRSRGISLEDAYVLMIGGFTNEILDRISLDSVRGYVRAKLRHKLSLIQEKGSANG
ncbi:MAG: Fe-S cluster assembly protein SufD [FCB group bacterium]|nr:Fe-S cluster assembly protein SufD [FCB group bacterium]